MTPKIATIPKKTLVGYRMRMSYAQYTVAALWGRFMPRRKEIKNTVTNDLYSLAIYPPHHFSHFDPANEFERWATAEVNTADDAPEGMEVFIIPAGLYAVFTYQGLATDVARFFQNIFQVWLPQSAYQLDDRPHFEVLGEKYKNNDPTSEEEIWIPIKMK